MKNIKTVEEYQILAVQIAADLHNNPELLEKVLKEPKDTLINIYDISSDIAGEMINEDPYLKERFSSPIDKCVCTAACCVTRWVKPIDEDFKINPAIPVQNQLLINLINSGHIKTQNLRKNSD